MTNETVSITIEDDSGWLASHTIPAFTQEIPAVRESVKEHLKDYLNASLDNKTPTSVGDFVLWLIRRVSETEPREVDYESI